MTNEILINEYDQGETLRFIGESVGAWIETDTWQEVQQ